MQNPARPGRVDSLANFQIYTLAVRSRAGCFEKRDEERGKEEGAAWGLDGDMLGILGFFYGRTMLDFLRACVRASVYQNFLSPSPPRGQVSRRANRLKVRSPGFDGAEWDDFCDNRPRLFDSPRFNAPITMRMKAMESLDE